MAAGIDAEGVAARLKLNPWVARNLVGQARRFGVGDLERIYSQLLATDRDIKTGRVEGDLALDLLVVELTGR
jgi:DNA polymerase III delta subunit